MNTTMHPAILRALDLAGQQEGTARLAASTGRRRRPDLPVRDWRTGSLIGLLNRQISDAQGKLRTLTDPGARMAQLRLIAELRKHLLLELPPQRTCA